MLKCVVFGGSNSVIGKGFSYGLESRCATLNLALGASTSLQNLYELARHSAEVRGADLVITESNVNDSHAIQELGAKGRECILRNIDAWYQQLAAATYKVIVVLIPVRQDEGDVGDTETILAVDKRHRDNAERYGFPIVDIPAEWAKLEPGDVRHIQADSVHPMPVFMYHLARNLIEHVICNPNLFRKPASHSVAENERNFVSVGADTLAPNRCEWKENSKFRRQCINLQEHPVTFPPAYWGCNLVALETWSEGPCGIVVSGEGRQIKKAFGDQLCFNEILDSVVIDANTRIESHSFSGSEATEPSILAPRKVPLEAPVKLCGVMLRTRSQSKSPSVQTPTRCIDLQHLIPDTYPYISSGKLQTKKLDALFAELDLHLLIESAEKLKRIDLPRSCELMRMALRLNPQDRTLRKRLRRLTELRDAG